MARSAKILISAAVLLASNASASACPWCRLAVADGIYDENFIARLAVLLLPVLLLTAACLCLYNAPAISNKFWRAK